MDTEYCARCDYDKHICKGCGEPLKHGAEICLPCKVELNEEYGKANN